MGRIDAEPKKAQGPFTISSNPILSPDEMKAAYIAILDDIKRNPRPPKPPRPRREPVEIDPGKHGKWMVPRDISFKIT